MCSNVCRKLMNNNKLHELHIMVESSVVASQLLKFTRGLTLTIITVDYWRSQTGIGCVYI